MKKIIIITLLFVLSSLYAEDNFYINDNSLKVLLMLELK